MYPLSAALLGFNCFVDEAWPATDVVVTRDLPYGSNFNNVTGEVGDHLQREQLREHFELRAQDVQRHALVHPELHRRRRLGRRLQVHGLNWRATPKPETRCERGQQRGPLAAA